MANARVPFQGVEEDKAVRAILEGTSTEIGERFFAALVENLAQVLNTYGAWVTEFLAEERRLHARAFILGDKWFNDFEYEITGTPCERVVVENRLLHVPERLLELYKGNPDLIDLNLQGLGDKGAVSYLGVPLLDVDGQILGHLSVIDIQPIPKQQQIINIFRIFANRASAELQRLRAEKEIRQKEEKLRRLFDSAMDAIIELDKDLGTTRINPAAAKVFGIENDKAVGTPFKKFLTEDSSVKLLFLSQSLRTQPEGRNYIWIPGGFEGITAQGKTFPAEGTLSSFEMDHERFFTIILRDINDKRLAEHRIQSLTIESEYLKEELRYHRSFDEIIGASKPLLRVLHDVKKVAATETTVLIFGETGTGKELVARAIHKSSPRKVKPFVKVNCAAIPASLIESEFFGHEKGAFTGATAKREGRFALANSGTIFLDEIGELSIDLQAKLLRVLQEGEFEPVGSSKTITVDVRVIAATNRDLLKAVASGTFREDLYYRLNVFPIELPPLRDRGDDIIMLAGAFMEKFSKRTGTVLQPLSEEEILRLKSYKWPGNIRELQNVIERAVITAVHGRLNLIRALPEIAPKMAQPAAPAEETARRLYTSQELIEFERSNIILALENSGWRVSGEGGAAQLLGMPPTTLSSRMKALGIKRPA